MNDISDLYKKAWAPRMADIEKDNLRLKLSRLEEIQFRCKKASCGPWLADFGNWQIEIDNSEFDFHRDGICSFAPSDRDGVGERRNPIDPWDDAEFIAHSREDIPYLVNQVLELETALEVITTAMRYALMPQNNPRVEIAAAFRFLEGLKK